MSQLGFRVGRSSTVVFVHLGCGSIRLAHGDDFEVSGLEAEIVWLRNHMERVQGDRHDDRGRRQLGEGGEHP